MQIRFDSVETTAGGRTPATRVAREVAAFRALRARGGSASEDAIERVTERVLERLSARTEHAPRAEVRIAARPLLAIARV